MRLTKTPNWILVTIVLALATWQLSGLLEAEFLTDDFHILRFITYGPQNGPSFDPDDSSAVFQYFGRSATESFQLYRPFVACLFRLSYDLHGLNAQPYFVENLIFHLLGGLMVWLLGRQLFPRGSKVMALSAMALFLVHPLQVQVPAWTAARSDSLAWLFGSFALFLQVSKRERHVLSLLSLALSLLSKEAAISFVGAMVALEFCGPGLEGRPIKARIQRSLFPLGLALVYLGLRSYAMRGEFNYAGRSLQEFLGQEGLENILHSAWTALGSSSTLFFSPGPWHDSLRVAMALLQLILLFLAFYYSQRQSKMLTVVLIALMAAPFCIASLVSRLDDNFYNTRSCYISLGVIGVVLAAIPRPRLGGGLVFCLLLGLIPISHRVVHYYATSSQSSQAMLEELRLGPEQFSAAADGDVAILNFQEVNWFRGGFAFSGAMDVAVTRPFCSRDWRLHKVRSDRSIQGYSPQVELSSLFPTTRDRLIVVEMRPRPGETRESFRLVYPPESVQNFPSAVTVLSPENGSVSTLDPAIPESLVPRYDLRHPYGDKALYLVYLLTKNGLGRRIEAKTIENLTGPEGPFYRLTLPALPAAILNDPQVLGTVLIGIVVIAPNGDYLDASPLTMIEVKGPS